MRGRNRQRLNEHNQREIAFSDQWVEEIGRTPPCPRCNTLRSDWGDVDF